MDATSQFKTPAILRQEAFEELSKVIQEKCNLNNQNELEEFERKVLGITNRIADLTIALVIQEKLDSEELRQDGKEFLKASGNKRVCKGIRLVTVRFAGGTEVVLRASYWGRKRLCPCGERA